MTLKETPAVRHYNGWTYTVDPTREWRRQWEAQYKGNIIIASTEATLKRKVDDWWNQDDD